jgi:hypothetical protein
VILAFTNRRNALVSYLAVMLLLIPTLLILIDPLPSFADRIVTIHQHTTLDIGCDLSSGDNFTGTTKILTYDQPTKLIFNCERSGGHVNLKKGESVSLQCLHENPLTIPKHVKMKAGELFYILCNEKQNS